MEVHGLNLWGQLNLFVVRGRGGVGGGWELGGGGGGQKKEEMVFTFDRR